MKIWNSILWVSMLFLSISLIAQENTNKNKFRQLGQELPTPNVYRAASGAPGHEYWQQQADYVISVTLDDEEQKIYGEETITYTNNSPDKLDYLWLQLDQNVRAKDADSHKTETSKINDEMKIDDINALIPWFDGGFKIDEVKDINNNQLHYTINKTMMRVDLPSSMKKGDKVSFKVKWWYNINDRMKLWGRSGYEYFEEDENYLYTIAQFFPRMVSYNEVEGWQNKQFLGRGEFTLDFGNYDVKITVPADHLVAATGTLQNPNEVLTKTQRKRLEAAKKAYEQPIIIATQEEAIEKEKKKEKENKTWHFKAENVRDFAFANSRKFIWDAMAVQQMNGKTVMAMSMYPKEGNPLWEKFSTKAVAHTLKWYSHYTFDYPYPVAWSINAANIGMEYPMICFNFGRCEKDGTYSKRTKYGMIGVIIHEVGHNYFPMIVNSDERQWTWMDEGLNSFIQYLSEQQWERDFPSRYGEASKITDYMKGSKDRITPIMTNSESIFQFGKNAYAKPATALNILRETIMGRELFDFAFKTYAKRWMFKKPSPADFFRTMEDASGVDLDWFWRGWFYTTDYVDIAIESVKWYQIDSKNPETEFVSSRKKNENLPRSKSSIRNEEEIIKTQDEIDTSIRDFYTDYDPFEVTIIEKDDYKTYQQLLTKEEENTITEGYNFYEITFKNKGGLLSPLLVEFEYVDGTKEMQHIPAEIWRQNHHTISKVFVTKKEAKSIVLDPYLETADTDTSDNYYPPQKQISRFELFKDEMKQKQMMQGNENLMQKNKRAEKLKNKKSGTN